MANDAAAVDALDRATDSPMASGFDAGGGGTDVNDGSWGQSCEITGCATGQVCCPGLGYCYDPSCVACCPPPDAGAGPACESNDTCGAASYCEGLYCRSSGLCTPRPSSCDPTPAPICGCDGVTYLNACTAALMGQSVRNVGACPPRDAGPPPCTADADCYAGQFCCTGTHTCYDQTCPSCCAPSRVCTSESDCVGSEYCAVCTGQSDGGSGGCYRRPLSCEPGVASVCGCNGVTYASECAANMAGQLVSALGPCGG